MDRFDGFRVVRAQLLAAGERIEATRRFWSEAPPAPVSHVAAVWAVVEREAERLIFAHRLAAAPGARVVVRWLALNVAVAARGGWPAPVRFPRSLARDLSAADLEALTRARPALERELLRALGRAPDAEMALDDGARITAAEWLAGQLDWAGARACALAA